MTQEEEVRKGPWTEQEDSQLMFYVKIFGDRRWDFIAKVSGLKRTGKSCRLRWVNYLHPGLKRGKMTPLEERLVLELHSKWGNRWSRIARKLPGRTDNEIKNYWRTHMRKKAHEKKKTNSPSSSSSSSSSSNSSSSISSKGNSPNLEYSKPVTETKERSFYDTGGLFAKKSDHEMEDWSNNNTIYSMDEIWRDIELSSIKPFCDGGSYFSGDTVASPVWDGSLWAAEPLIIASLCLGCEGSQQEESRMFPPTISDQLYSFHSSGNLS